MPAQNPVQVRPRQARRARGRRHVAFVQLQERGGVVAFEAGEGFGAGVGVRQARVDAAGLGARLGGLREGLDVAEDHAALEVVAELAHVAGPAASSDRGEELGGEERGELDVAEAHAAQEHVREHREVFEALAERRDARVDDREAVVEVFAETTGGDLWSQFAGHDYELKSPLVNAGARIYDPDNAVFLSPDPVLATAGIGAAPYQYAFQNPNSYTDPTGMWPIGTGGIDCLTAGCLELHGIDVVLDPTGTHYINRGSGRPDGLNAGTAHGDSRGGGRATAGTGRSFVDTDLALVNMVDRLGVDDFFAGMGDSLSFGLTGRFRGATGIDGAGGSVDRSSDAYDNGEWAAVGTSLANIPGLIRSGVRSGAAWVSRTLRGRGMNSPDALQGVERASAELIDAVRSRRTVEFAVEGSDELRYLDAIGAEANVGGAAVDHILLRADPSKAALLEEFLHGTQHSLGIIKRLGQSGAEWHVKDFMIRHARLLGLGAEDVRRLTILRDMGL